MREENEMLERELRDTRNKNLRLQNSLDETNACIERSRKQIEKMKAVLEDNQLTY